MGERICALAAKHVKRKNRILFMDRFDYPENYGFFGGDARK
jgi:hypothetical protein